LSSGKKQPAPKAVRTAAPIQLAPAMPAPAARAPGAPASGALAPVTATESSFQKP
jgi:hypothetical protein